jgi:hypothetical protein
MVAGATAVFVVVLGGIVASTREAARATQERDRAATAEQIANKERDRALVAEQAATKERDRALGAEQAATLAETQAKEDRNRALTARQRADTAAATANAINSFLRNDLLSQAGASAQARPGNKSDPDLKVRTALDRAASGIEGKFEGQPLVEASIRQTIAKTYEDLGLYPEAERQINRALDLRRRVLGASHPDTLDAMTNLIGLYVRQAKYDLAEPLAVKALETNRGLLAMSTLKQSR